MTLIETPGTLPERNMIPPRSIDAVKSSAPPDIPGAEWKSYEKVLFRFFFIYFVVQAVPLDWKYYRDIFSLDWSSFHFSNIFYLARYAPRFFSGAPEFADWFVVAVIALIGTITWGIVDSKNRAYNNLYYWLRVLVRYRLALGLLAYGFIKFFPLQMPYPSISNLNTNYGDIEAWKLFSMSTGIVPGYESFLGLIEILAALLLLYRKTASIGAFIVLPYTGNVVMSNLAYEGGEYVYALLLVTFALLLIVFDAPRLFSLTSLENPTPPNRFRPLLKEGWQKNGRLILKGTFVFVFVFFYGYKTYVDSREDVYHFPKTPGLAKASGLYNVREFRINDELLPYSPTDPVRWKDVVFERWATLSIRSNRPVTRTVSPTEEIFMSDEKRTYELSGMAGRHYYSYQIDQFSKTLTLRNRNKHYASDNLVLHYNRPDDNTIILSGIDKDRNSIYIILDRIEKKYLLEEAAKNGRRRGLKL